VLLAIVVAVALGVVLAVLLGAARSVTAMDRLREETRASDVVLGGGDQVGSLLETVSAAPGVLAAGAGRELFVRPQGSELFPGYNLRSFAPYPLPGGVPVDVPIIVEGRAPDQARVDQVVMNRALADVLGLRVGDRVVLESVSFEWVDASYSGQDPGPPDGPEVEAELVGVALAPVDFTRTGNVLYLTTAYADRYQDQVRTYGFVNASLTDTRLAQLEAEQRFTVGAEDNIDVQSSPNSRLPEVHDSLETIAAALRLVAATFGLAALSVVGLLTVRLAREVAADRATLIAIGWTRADVMGLVVVVLAPALLVGLVVGVVLGVVASPSTSVGLAAAVDPAGRSVVVAPVLVAGVGVVAMAVLASLLGIAALRASRSASPARATAPPAPPLEPPLPIALGVRRALFGATHSGGRLSRSAVAAVAAGTTIAVAALIVGASIDRLQVDPFLSGQGPASQRVADGGEGSEGLAVADRAMATLEEDERVVDLAAIHVAFGVTGPGGRDLPVLVYDARRGTSGAAFTSGRFPTQSDEVAIGPASLAAMGLQVGDHIALRHQGGRAEFKIVGAVLLPEGDFDHDVGVVLTTAGARFLGGIDGTEIHQVVFTWGPGVDAIAADDELAAAGFNVLTSQGRLTPASVSSLGDVRSLAALVACLVLALGLVTAIYAVTVTRRVGRREAATLRALGLAPRALAMTTEVQGLTIALVGVVIGLPAGIFVGRHVWSLIAERAHVVDLAVVDWASLATVTGATLVGVALLSLPPAFSDARQPFTDALRAE
jgi:predicted lysophospholipase L1 biosynthesis ABC-type transport system permease subunit